jgi:hypothetical protein
VFCQNSIFLCFVRFYESAFFFFRLVQNFEKQLLTSSCLFVCLSVCLSLRLSVRPSVRPSFRPSVLVQQFGSHWTESHEIWHLIIFRKSVEETESSLKSDKNNEYFTCRPIYIYDHISLSSSQNEKYFRQNCGENQNPYFMVSNFSSENLTCMR